MERRGISIRVVSEAGERPTAEWTLSGAPLYAAAVGLFLLVVLFGFLMTRVVDLARRAELADRLGRRNAELEQNMQKVLALEQELASIRSVDREIRTWAGLSPEPSEASRRRAASGGGDGAGARVGAGGGAGLTAGTGERANPGGGPVIGEEPLVAPPSFDARAVGVDAGAVASAHPLAWPLIGWVSSEFQEERSGEGPHSGIDIVAAQGTPVVAAAAGRVIVSGSDPQYGLLLAIDHGDGLVTLYGHNATLTVARGATVVAGQGIAAVGNTGRSTAPHLHFEVRKDGCALDPRLFLPPRDASAHDAAPGAGAGAD